MKQWTHDTLATDLAAYLRGPDRMVWTDIQLGSAGSPRPDVYTILKSFIKPCPSAFEVKVSRSDFLADVTAGKWTKYLQYAYSVTFACEVGLLFKDDVPQQCGLIVRHENAWRYAKRPLINPVEIPRSAWMKLLIDGVHREGPLVRARSFNIDNGFAKRYGSEAARWVSDAASIKERVGYAEERSKLTLERAQKEANEIRERARRDGGERWNNLLAALGLPADAEDWTVRQAIERVRHQANGSTVDVEILRRVQQAAASVARQLDELARRQ